ncbi:hypothetical protein [Runella sp.]|uniref:hypothetical protein n=1 Tax=Runella sp. TaxID=1960881 RepID=UPI003D0FE79F
MNNEENKTEQIDRYLDDEMMPAERLAFEQQMLHEEELRLDIEAQKTVKGYIRQKAEEAELQRMFNGFHDELTKNEAPKVIVLKNELDEKKRRLEWGGMPYFAVAASIALIIISVWVIVKQDNKVQSDVEIRNNGDRQSFRIPLLIWETQKDVRVKKQTVFKDAVIINDTEHPLHYRFTDTFELHLNPVPTNRPKLSLEFDNTTKSYKVWLNGRAYDVKQTETITPLK